jgi:effector-binding domain-containing protein
MVVAYGDIKSGVGAVSSWEGEESGNGKLTITESIPDQSIKMDLEIMDQGTAQTWYTFEPEGQGTKITTGMTFDVGMNPIGRWMCVFMKPEMEKAFDYNLSKLKEIAEAKPKFTVQFSEETTPSLNYVGIAATSISTENIDAMSAHMAKSYGELAMALGKAKVEITGPAFCIINKWDEATKLADFVCAFPVAANAKVPAKYKIMQTESTPAIKVIHTGSYDNLGDTHEQIGRYMEFKNLEMNGPALEVYVTDPEIEKDTTKWVTEIYYPVKQ